jgi:hypothetical protein
LRWDGSGFPAFRTSDAGAAVGAEVSLPDRSASAGSSNVAGELDHDLVRAQPEKAAAAITEIHSGVHAIRQFIALTFSGPSANGPSKASEASEASEAPEASESSAASEAPAE